MESTLFYLIFSMFIIVLFYFILKQHFTYWKRQGINGWCFMDFKGFIKEHHEYTLDMFKKYGRIYAGFIFFSKFIVINEPDMIRELWVKNFEMAPNHRYNYLGESLKVNNMIFFMSANEKWKRIRSIITPAFTSIKLKAMLSHISEICEQFIENLEIYAKTGEGIDMRKYIGAFSMDVICSCIYGINIDSIKNPEHPIITNVNKVLNVNGNLSMAICALFPSLAKLLRLNFFDMNAIHYLDNLFNKVVENRRKSDELGNTDPAKKKIDFIQLMLDSEKSDPKYVSNNYEENDINIEMNSSKALGVLSSDEMSAQGILFFVAGYDTTSSTLSHLIYYLSENKDCQQLLYEELKDVKEFSYENLSELKYLNAVIDETLRLAPPLLRIQRQGSHDIELKGVKIPAETTIDVLPYALHRDPDLWPDPYKFNPDRFLKPKHHPWAYLPFGGGPRICVGQRFALNEMRMCCAKLFKKFEFSLTNSFEKLEYFKGNILLSPKNMMVNLKQR